MEKEIIGYKAPMDFVGSNDFVHKGEIFTKNADGLSYCNHGIVKHKNPLPAPIVELWEPVYKEPSNVLWIGGKEITLIKRDIDFFMCREKEGDLYLNINSFYKMKWESLLITFGEKTTLAEIKALVDLHNLLLKQES